MWNSQGLDQCNMAQPAEQDLSIEYPLSGAKGFASVVRYSVSVIKINSKKFLMEIVTCRLCHRFALSTQWRAVRTYLKDSMDPPQRVIFDGIWKMPTIKG